MGLLAVIALVLLVAWAFGSIVARFLGAVVVLESLLRTVVAHDFGGVPPLAGICVGLTLWLFGHWLWAAKHHNWRTGLALRAFRLPVLRHLAPIPTGYVRKQRQVAKWPVPQSN